MASIDHARTLYDDVTESSVERSADELARELRERAKEIRGAEIQKTRGEVAEVLEHASPEEREDTARNLEEAAQDVGDVFKGSSSGLKKLEGNTAGEAQLDSSVIRVDPAKITFDGGKIVDKKKAGDILLHEQEHTKQSSVADAGEITIGSQKFDARKIREAAAISVQSRIDFLSDEYRSIAQNLTMDAADRELVRKGQFKALEARKNRVALAA
ncbi:MAG: hypothetical protein PHE68_00390 [Candidatus Peribacteraceae bacterium]|nr:hypothetical protein [Candidatus Peribacteraceae bacterium]MDD5075316.1 hypothetical protein [Candidatus Peribacteraceae bacterium]